MSRTRTPTHARPYSSSPSSIGSSTAAHFPVVGTVGRHRAGIALGLALGSGPVAVAVAVHPIHDDDGLTGALDERAGGQGEVDRLAIDLDARRLQLGRVDDAEAFALALKALEERS